MSAISIGDIVAVLRARDEASAVFKQAAGNIDAAMIKAAGSIDDAVDSQEELTAAIKAFSGSDAVLRASAYVNAVDAIGGAAKLTVQEQRQVNAVVSDAIAKYEALGQEAPPALRELQQETFELARAAEAAEPAVGKLSAEAFSLATHANDAAKKTDLWGAGLNFLKRAGAGLAIGALVKDFANATGQLADLNAQTGIGVRELQRLKFAGDQVDVSIEEIAQSALQMQRRIADGEIDLKRFGVTLEQLKAMDPGEQFEAMASAVAKIPNQAERVSAAMEVMGRGGGKVLALVTQDLKALGDEAERVGAVMSDETVAAGDDLGDSFGKLVAVGKSFVGEILGSVAPALSALANGLSTVGGKVVEGVRGIQLYGKNWLEAVQHPIAFFNKIQTLDLRIPDLPQAPIKWFDDFGVAAQRARLEVDRTFDDLMAYSDQLDQQLDAEMKAAKAAEDHADKIRDLREELSGRGAIQAANDMLEALRAMPPIQNLTRDAQDRINRVMNEALAVYRALGQDAPKAIREVAAATFDWSTITVKVVDGLSAEFANVGRVARQQIPEIIAFYGAIEEGIKRTKIVTGTEGLRFGADTAVDPKKIGVPDLPSSFLKSIFGDAGAFGASLSQIITGAIQGGGNAVSAAGSMIGGKLAQGLATTLTGGAGIAIKGALGAGINAVLPGLGTLLGPLAEKAISFFTGLFNRDKGRDLVEGFLDSFEGGAAGLREQLNAFGAEGDRIWVHLTQEVKKGSVEQAQAAIAATKALLAEGTRAQQDAARATEAATREVAASQKAAIDSVKGEIGKLSGEYDRLAESIKDEAYEEVMGDVEKATRARMDAVAAERAAQESELAKLTSAMEDSINKVASTIEAAADRISSALGGISVPGIAPTEGRPPIDPDNSFGDGTDGYQWFGNGTVAMLHGWEKVTRYGRESGGARDVTIRVPLVVDGSTITEVIARKVIGG